MSLETHLTCDYACCKRVIKFDDVYNGVVRLKEATLKGWSLVWKQDNCLVIDKAYCPDHAGNS